MKVFEDYRDIPAADITPRLTPELKARADALVEELHAAGFHVALALDGPKGEQVPTWALGEPSILIRRLAKTIGFLQASYCDCPVCRQKRGQVQA